MQCNELERIIRAVAGITNQHEIMSIGSQSILAAGWEQNGPFVEVMRYTTLT